MTSRPRDREKRPKQRETEEREGDERDERDERDEDDAEEQEDSAPNQKTKAQDKKDRTPSFRDKGSAGKTPNDRKPPTEKATIWQRATYRWTAITAVMAALLVLYTQHPYYQGAQFAPWRPIYVAVFCGWLAVGLFYCKATLEKFSGTRYTVRDGGLHLVLLAKHAYEDVLSRTQWYLVGGFAVAGLALGVMRARTPEMIEGAGAGGLLRKIPNPDFFRSNLANAIIFGSLIIAIGIFAQGLRPRRLWRLIKNRRIKTTLLAIIVKGFFTPLMTGFLSGHLNSASRAWLGHKNLAPLDFKAAPGMDTIAQLKGWWAAVGSRLPELIPTGHDLGSFFTPWIWSRADFSWGLGLAYDMIFIVDCGWALMGYSSESRWLGNKTRGVEPTGFGWVVCIFCYPPFNNILGTYLPLEGGATQFPTNELILGLKGDTWLLIFRAATVGLFAIYSAATVAFGFKFSNLTNRGVVMRGPYRFIRHPAYVCKCSAWWLEHIPSMTLAKALFLTLLCAVYALRAWTEERHLSKDPDYLVYKKKTPWVAIPGVF